jgi:outer membrane protein OmpA-like peptidoglycan-associated protein
MSHRAVLKSLSMVAVLLCATFSAHAQEDQPPSKVDIFAGYSYLNPRGKLNGVFLRDLKSGFNVAGTYYFSKYAGFTVDGAHHMGDQSNISTVMAGPTFRFPSSAGVTPFVHGLVGWHYLDLFGVNTDSGVGFLLGGGLDFSTKWPRLGIRLVQADFAYGSHNPVVGTHINQYGARLSTGLLFKFGTIGPPPVPPSATCKAEPAEVFEGEPVTVTVSPQNFNPKHKLTYNWSGQGVNVKGTDTTAQVDTKGLQPGTYPVSVTVADKKLTAQCTANIVIKQPRPPQITCSANPTTAKPGESVQISCQGTSPDNRQLKYTHQASAGQIQGEGNNVTLSTEGAQPGSTVTVNSTVTDDRNLSASTSTTVNVEAPPPPPPPPAPEAQKINTLDFKKSSARVDNAAKAILDDVALRLQRDADAHAVIVGNVADRENKRIASQRAINAKAYLVKEKGIDPSRVEVRAGTAEGTTADIWIVPAGATFNEQGTTPVQEPKARATAKKPATKKQ